MAFLVINRNIQLFSYLFLSLLFTLFINSASASSSSDDPSAPSVYEILQNYGLPSGLLPDSVKSYSLADDGSFQVQLEKECYVQFEYLVYYDKKITGKLSIGSITDLKGIEVQRLLFWFDVDEIKVDLPPSNNIYFQVGLINKKLDVDQFQTVHSCRRNRASLASCGGSLRQVFQLPNPLVDAEMLITE